MKVYPPLTLVIETLTLVIETLTLMTETLTLVSKTLTLEIKCYVTDPVDENKWVIIIACGL